ncbi:acetoacetate decarboxylase family protein [Gordonia sputi]
MSSPSTHTVAGTTLTMPVEVRDARCMAAGFSADADAMARTIAASGASPLRPLRIRPGRGMVMLVFVDYVDGDLGPYNEFGVCLLVENPAAPASPLSALGSVVRGDAHALIQRLPVDGEFTRQAGRGIWGFPKFLADFDVDHDGSRKRGSVSEDGRLIASLETAPGLPVPAAPGDAELTAYSRLDGKLRSIPWQLGSLSGVRARIGGATLTLGGHPIADELRGLKLARHAAMTMSVGHLAMTFDDATDL